MPIHAQVDCRGLHVVDAFTIPIVSITALLVGAYVIGDSVVFATDGNIFFRCISLGTSYGVGLMYWIYFNVI